MFTRKKSRWNNLYELMEQRGFSLSRRHYSKLGCTPTLGIWCEAHITNGTRSFRAPRRVCLLRRKTD